MRILGPKGKVKVVSDDSLEAKDARQLMAELAIFSRLVNDLDKMLPRLRQKHRHSGWVTFTPAREIIHTQHLDELCDKIKAAGFIPGFCPIKHLGKPCTMILRSSIFS